MQKRNYFYVLPSFYYNVAKFYIPVTFKWLPNAVFIISDISNWNISKECCFFFLLRISKLFIYDIFDFSNSRICANYWFMITNRSYISQQFTKNEPFKKHFRHFQYFHYSKLTWLGKQILWKNILYKLRKLNVSYILNLVILSKQKRHFGNCLKDHPFTVNGF